MFVNGAEVSSLDPHAANGIPEQRVARALFECLVERGDDELTIRPAAAESYAVSADGLEYRFQLRAAARWSNGDALLASDFEASFRRLLEKETAAAVAAQLDVVVGARAYRTRESASAREADEAWKQVGIKATAPLELTIRLELPQLQFLQLLACPQFVPVHLASLRRLQAAHPVGWRQRWTRPEHLVTNGAFVLRERALGARLRLQKSATYWDREHVGMQTIDALPLESFGTALNMYLAGEVDWLDGNVPSLLVDELWKRPDFHTRPYFGCYFLRLNTTRPPWSDRRLRLALSLCIDRVSLCQRLLRAGQRPAYELVPWNLLSSGWEPGEYADLVLAAWHLLEEAGLRGPGAAPLPTLEFHFNSNELHRDIAEAVAADWKRTLGIETVLVNQEWKAYLDAQRRLQYDVSRSSWIADVPDGLNFLEIMCSGSDNNRTGWSDARYDELIERARREQESWVRADLLLEAARILRHESPVVPLFGYVAQDLRPVNVEGFSSNLLNDQYPKRWRWSDRTQDGAAGPTPEDAQWHSSGSKESGR